MKNNTINLLIAALIVIVFLSIQCFYVVSEGTIGIALVSVR